MPWFQNKFPQNLARQFRNTSHKIIIEHQNLLPAQNMNNAAEKRYVIKIGQPRLKRVSKFELNLSPQRYILSTIFTDAYWLAKKYINAPRI